MDWDKEVKESSSVEFPDTKITTVCNELDVLLKSMKNLKSTAKAIIVQRNAEAKAHSQFASAIHNWCTLEKNGISALEGKADNYSAPELLEKLGASFSADSRLAVVTGSHVIHSLLELIRFEVAWIESLKMDMGVARKTLLSYKKESDKHATMEKQLKDPKFKEAVGKSKAARLETQLSESRKFLERLKVAVDYTTKGLLCSELKRFAVARTERLRVLTIELAAIMINYGESLANSWKSCSKVAKVMSCVEAASKIHSTKRRESTTAIGDFRLNNNEPEGGQADVNTASSGAADGNDE